MDTLSVVHGINPYQKQDFDNRLKDAQTKAKNAQDALNALDEYEFHC